MIRDFEISFWIFRCDSLCIPVPQSSRAEVVLIGEVAGQRVHASHGDSRDGTECRTGAPAAAREFHERRDGLQAL